MGLTGSSSGMETYRLRRLSSTSSETPARPIPASPRNNYFISRLCAENDQDMEILTMRTTATYGTTSWDEIVWLGLNHDETRLADTVRLGPSRVQFRFTNPDLCRKLVQDLHLLATPQAIQLHRTLDVIRTMRSAIRATN